ncbi:hypothetical protein [Kineococcus terrestris]|uniref:hypothetical protein n=1 Tax=Kineococcus terrestris TaxID=2044856 RepID=UPI0034DAF63E
MSDAWAALLAAVLAAAATVLVGLRPNARDRRDREAIREGLELAKLMPPGKHRRLLNAHAQHVAERYVTREWAKAERYWGRAMGVLMLVAGAFVAVDAILPAALAGQGAWSTESIVFGVIGGIISALGAVTLILPARILLGKEDRPPTFDDTGQPIPAPPSGRSLLRLPRRRNTAP